MGRVTKPTAIGTLHKAYRKFGKQVAETCNAEAAFIFRFHKSSLPPHNVTYTEDEVVHQTKVLCRDFIYFKLKENSLLDFKLKSGKTPTDNNNGASLKNNTPTDVSKEIISIATTFEEAYPHLFEDIGTYLKMTYQTANHVQHTYNVAATEIFNGAITWARIIALFSFTGALTVDCVKHGYGKFANLIVECMQKFVRKRLATWIVSAGGWVRILYF